MKKFSKILMIFCVLFSQLSGAIEVFAEVFGEESGIIVSLDESSLEDHYKLIVKGNDKINDDNNYDICLTSSYKYAYDDIKVDGYNNVKINTTVVSGSELKSEDGYAVDVNSIETQYNGVYSIFVKVVDNSTETCESVTDNVGETTKVVDLEDKFDIKADGEIIQDDTYTVLEDKDILFSSDVDLHSVKSDVVFDVTDDFSVNYEGMLFGTYSYEWDVLVDSKIYKTKTIKVNYNSTNDTEADIEEENINANATILTDANTAGVKFYGMNAYVTSAISVDEFKNSISMPGYEVKIVSSGVEVTEGSIFNDMSLVISKDGLVLSYDIYIVGDVNLDSVVDYIDVIEIVKSIIEDDEYYFGSADANADGNVDIFDVTKIVYVIENHHIWDNQVDIDQDNLLNLTISSDATEEVKLGDTFTVRFSLNNFNYNVISGLSGNINYDDAILRLDEVNVYDMEMYYNEDGKFIIFGSDYNSEDVLIECVFTAIGASEEEYVSISDLVAAYAGEEVRLSSDSVGMSFEITYTSNKGGDVEETENKGVTLVNNTASSRVLSSDSYLADLIIEGIDFEFSPYTFNYNITVGSDVETLNLTAILSSNYATYSVYGNENFKAGENIVTIVVTAEDGSTHTYTLIVNKEKEETTDKADTAKEEKNSNVSRTIIIILIILVIIGLIYLIFKDDEEDNISSNKNEEKKEKKNK